MERALGRSVVYLIGKLWLMQLLYVDDFEWHATGQFADETPILVVFWLALLGVPFSWKKFRGGLKVDYVTLWATGPA